MDLVSFKDICDLCQAFDHHREGRGIFPLGLQWLITGPRPFYCSSSRVWSLTDSESANSGSCFQSATAPGIRMPNEMAAMGRCMPGLKIAALSQRWPPFEERTIAGPCPILGVQI